MPRNLDPEIVSASEIASYSFCPEAWRLGSGLELRPKNEAELARGDEFHEKTASIELQTQAASQVGFVLIVLGVVALALYLVTVIYR